MIIILKGFSPKYLKAFYLSLRDSRLFNKSLESWQSTIKKAK
ncbi:hypothetical protein [Helicobacter sp. T3_23-1056]